MIFKSSRILVITSEKYFNEIYITVLSYSISIDFIDEENEELYSMLRYIFRSIIFFSAAFCRLFE